MASHFFFISDPLLKLFCSPFLHKACTVFDWNNNLIPIDDSTLYFLRLALLLRIYEIKISCNCFFPIFLFDNASK